MRAQVLVVMLLLAAMPVASGAEGRALTVSVTIDGHIWTSDETVEVEVEVSGAPFNRDILLEWTLSDESGILQSGNQTFRIQSSNHVEDVDLEKFYSGGLFHDFDVSISIDSSIASDSMPFMVLRNTKLPSANNILVFGDSLSDMGNAKDSVLDVPDVPPYWQGRFSNGPVWVEHVSDEWGITTTYGSATNAGDNRAFGGSQTGQGYSYFLLPNTGTQINNYLANVQSSISSNEVVFLWAGGNDFLYGLGNPTTISQNMASHVRALEAAGASRFVVANLPPLELTPEGSSRSSQQQQTLSNDIQSYNSKLAVEMTNLSSTLGIDIILIDAWSLFNEIVNNADHAGITNIQDSACISSGSILPLPICNGGDTVVSNADEYLFFDKAHPTATMHEVIGEFALNFIGADDTDGDGVLDTFDQCEWTDDISTVDIDGCDWAQRDDDSDSVANGIDDCPDTIAGYAVDVNGCADYQRDSDEDGLTDDIDPCPNDIPGDDHDSDGCIDLVDVDDDNDGHLDENDACPLGMIGNHSADFDNDGCHDHEDSDDDNDGLSDEDEFAAGSNPYDQDSDDDGVWDGADAFPIDPNETIDSDLDGVGDNSDAFPYDSREWADSDDDEVGDNSDAFPEDPTEWEDNDGDGIGDNSDACRLEFGTSWYPLGCPDRDGDKFADTNDEFPDDILEWVDTDGDGVGDNSDLFPLDSTDWLDSDSDGYGDNRDAFPMDETEWNDTDLDGCGDNSDALPLDGSECYDSDNDGVGDNSDPWPNNSNEWIDSDHDGVGDNSDFAPHDSSETKDTDGDGVGDNADPWPKDSTMKRDSDGDGVADSVDAFPSNPSMDSWAMIIVSMILITGFVAVLLFLFIRSKKPPKMSKLWSPESPIEAPSFETWD